MKFLSYNKDSFQWTEIGVTVNGFLMSPYKGEGLEHREGRVMAIIFFEQHHRRNIKDEVRQG